MAIHNRRTGLRTNKKHLAGTGNNSDANSFDLIQQGLIHIKAMVCYCKKTMGDSEEKARSGFKHAELTLTAQPRY